VTQLELAAALRELCLTQTELAATLDISARTMRRYVAGDAPIPRVVALAIELLLLKYRAR
jgi:hypothetical protein